MQLMEEYRVDRWDDFIRKPFGILEDGWWWMRRWFGWVLDDMLVGVIDGVVVVERTILGFEGQWVDAERERERENRMWMMSW